MTTPITHPAGPKVTIAIPTLNRLRYLRLSLQSALSQTYRNIEVIVSNNASKDDTAAYLAGIQDSRLSVLTQPTLLPIAQSWSACVSAATGKYFLLLSDDDLLEPTAIEELVAGYESGIDHQTDAGIVYCGGYIVDAEGNKKKAFSHSPASESARDLALGFFGGKRDLWFCAILFRITDILPGFSDRHTWAADSEAWIRAVFKHDQAIYIAKELVQYRVHENTTASLSTESLVNGLQLLGQFAIDCSDRLPVRDATFSPRLTMAVNRLVMRTIPIRINEAHRNNKLKALRAYGSSLPVMANPYGLKQMGIGLMFLFLPLKAKPWLRDVIRGRAA